MLSVVFTKQARRQLGVLCVAVILGTMQVYPAFAAGNCMKMMSESMAISEPAKELPPCHAALTAPETESLKTVQNADGMGFGAESNTLCCILESAAAPPHSAYASNGHKIRTGNDHAAGWLSAIAAADVDAVSSGKYRNLPHDIPFVQRRLYLSTGSFLL